MIRPRFQAARALALAAAILGSLPSTSHAAHPALREYTTREGLPQKQVTALLQDRTGYVWAGTLAGGAARYDGHRWDVYDTAHGLPGEGINALALDERGRVCAATTGGAAIFDGGRWTRVPPVDDPLQRTIDDILPVGGGRYWLGTPFGLLLWDGAGTPRNPFASHPWGHDLVLTLAPDPAGGAWLGTTHGLAHLDAEPPRLTPVEDLPAGRVRAVLARPGAPLLVSLTDLGVFEQAGAAWRRVGDDRAPGRRVLTFHAEAAGSGIWMGTDDRGAYRYADGELQAFGADEGLADPHVNAILEDREGIFWFGTDTGLVKRGPSAFVTFDQADGFPEGPIFGMAEDAQHALWFTTADEGVVRRSPQGTLRRFTTADGLPDNRVFDVLTTEEGTWVTTRTGIARIEGDRVVRPKLPPGVPRIVAALARLPDGGIVLGGNDGLAYLRGGTVTRVPALEGHDVSSVFVTRDGTVWCGGLGWGASALRDTTPLTSLTRADGLPSDQVTSVFVDSRAGVWISTESGAWHRDASGTVRVLDRRTGLPDSYVYWAREDAQGRIWLGTNHGAAMLAADGAMSVFTTQDGLADDECNDDGFFVDAKGTVYVTTVGVSAFQGVRPPRPNAAPVAVVEGLLVGGHEVDPALPLPADPGPLTFRFAGLSFTDERAVRFEYRLLGLSENWTDAAPGQWETTYGGLGPGAYTLELRVRTGDGRVSTEPARLGFRVRPHWWQTRAAAALGGLLLFGLVYLVITTRERRLTHAQQRLEGVVAERTDELQRANRRLAELAVTDELTGVANRRRVLEALTVAMSLARRQGTPVALALADMDHFKEINDSLGHAAGDRLLVDAARAMQAALRNVDLLGRYGGEEFLVVLPGSDLGGAREACERLRRAVEGLEGDGAARPPTISIGVAAMDGPGLDPAELIRRADEALYRAKDAGRNRVVCHGVPA